MHQERSLSIGLCALVLASALPLAAGAATPGNGASAGATADKKPAPPKPEEDDPFLDEADTGQPTPAAAAQQGGTSPQVVKTGPLVLVLPFQPIYRSVPQAKIQMANELLAKELNQKDTINVLRGGVAKGGSEARGPTLEAAQKLGEEAARAEATHDGAKAIELRRRVLEELEKNAPAADPDTFVGAHHLLARAYMWSGQDEKAQELIETAARMRPGFTLPPGDYSRLYRKWARKAAEKVMAEKPTELLVKSGLPGAAITLDGRPMDVAPVLLEKVVPGRHLLGARVEGVPPYAKVIDVKPGKRSEVMVAFDDITGGSAVGAVSDAIAENAIPRKAVESAAQAGKEAGAAFVVTGALVKDNDRFHVHTYVVDVAKVQIKALDVVDFDLEMLTSESDVLRVVQNINATVSGFGSGESSVPMIEKRARAQTTVNQVSAAPTITAEDVRRPGEVAKTKEDKRPIFKPLKGTKVEIKDEEEE